MKLTRSYRVCLTLIVLGWAAGAMAQAPSTGVVVDIRDPDGLGRIKVAVPDARDPRKTREVWARLATLMAGNGKGTWFIPDVDDEVLVLFEGGDPRRPYVVGALWNGRQRPPETIDEAGSNDLKTIRSRNGVQITLDDTDGQETVRMETPGGQSITLRDGPSAVEIIDGNGNSIELAAGGITVTSSTKVLINAAVIEVSAGAVTVNSGLTKFSGVVQADTVITNSVISASYTPGAGNIW